MTVLTFGITYAAASLGRPSNKSVPFFRDLTCFRCEACAEVKNLWYRGLDTRTLNECLYLNYNLFVEDVSSTLDEVECDPMLQERFVIVQDAFENRYHYLDFEAWVTGMPPRLDPYLKAVVFDQPKEIGFIRGLTTEAAAWTQKWRRSRPQTEVVFTGMETSKADSGRRKMLRYWNFYLTHAIVNQITREEEAAEAEEEVEGDDDDRDRRRRELPPLQPPLLLEPNDKRFVVLVGKPKQWRYWFLARLFDLGDVWRSMDYTCPVPATLCNYFNATLNVNHPKNPCNYTDLLVSNYTDEQFQQGKRFVQTVEPRTFYGSPQQINQFTKQMFEPQGRIHVVLESQPASFEDPFNLHGIGWNGIKEPNNCAWEERLTEKTFNAIAYGHPFLLVGTNHALDLVKAHGFKTFGPCINETYANVHDPEERMIAVAHEMRRLSALSSDEYARLYTKCLKPIADANRVTLLTEIKEKQLAQRLYSWGMRETPAYDLQNVFHHRCNRDALKHDVNLPKCRK